jgi:hypothetical protein
MSRDFFCLRKPFKKNPPDPLYERSAILFLLALKILCGEADMLENPTFKKIESLVNECASLCNKEGWNFYGGIFSGPYEHYSMVSDGGNDFDFIRQHTKRLCTSEDLQRFLGLHVPENENTGEVATSQKEKPL